MRIVFAGTPEFAVPCLRAAASKGEVVAVYTQPDRPAGRGRGLTPSPVKLEAVQRGIPVYQPENFRSAESRAALRALEPDVMIVVAYGLILPQSVLDIPEHGCWNVHASLLPRWRGAAPIHRAIEAGDAESGVTIMRMDVGLDTGDMLLVERLPIAADDTTGTLHDKLAAVGGRLIVEALKLAACGGLRRTPQAAEGVTYAHKIEKQEAQLDWAQPAAVIARRIRAFNPFPGAATTLQGDSIKLWQAELVEAGRDSGQAPGTVLAADSGGIVVQCGPGLLRLTELQRAGGKRLLAAEFLRGQALAAGTVLGA